MIPLFYYKKKRICTHKRLYDNPGQSGFLDDQVYRNSWST